MADAQETVLEEKEQLKQNSYELINTDQNFLGDIAEDDLPIAEEVAVEGEIDLKFDNVGERYFVSSKNPMEVSTFWDMFYEIKNKVLSKTKPHLKEFADDVVDFIKSGDPDDETKESFLKIVDALKARLEDQKYIIYWIQIGEDEGVCAALYQSENVFFGKDSIPNLDMTEERQELLLKSLHESIMANLSNKPGDKVGSYIGAFTLFV